MYVVEKYKILYCPIPKVATSTWLRILLVLSEQFNDTLSIKKPHLLLKNLIPLRLTNYPPQRQRYFLENYLKFLIVRDPVTRLYSAYRSKFRSNAAATDNFKKKFGKLIVKTYRNYDGHADNITGRGVKFSEFVRFITDPEMEKKGTNQERHWSNYSSICHPCSINYDIIGKYETLSEDASLILHKMGASQTVHFPSRSELYKSPSSSSEGPNEYKNISTYYLQRLGNQYKSDFDLFNYSLPQKWKDV